MFRMYNCCVLLVLGLYLQGTRAEAEGGGTVLDNTIDDIKKQLADFQTKFQAQQSVNAKQATEIRTLQTKFQAQQSVNAKQATETSTLQTKFLAQQSVNAKQATEIRTLQTREAAQESKLIQLEGIIASRTSPIAFMARKTDVQNLGLNTQITFQQALLNQGNRYSTSSSKFSCPDHGVYVFVTTILSSPTSPTYFAIVQDGVTRGSGYTGSVGFSSATEMAVIKCQPGSYVWVKCHSTFHVLGQKAWHHSYFGGFRV